jgi:hypothetical protein
MISKITEIPKCHKSGSLKNYVFLDSAVALKILILYHVMDDVMSFINGSRLL